MVTDYIRSLLGENEQILLMTRQHWFTLLAWTAAEIAISVFLVLLGGLLAAAFPPAGLLSLLAIVPLGSLVRDVLVWYNTQYIVTNRRVIQVSGIINKNVIDSSIEKVNDVKLAQSVLGRFFNYGDVEILTASELGVNLFKRIFDPIRFKTVMLNAKTRLEAAEVHESTGAGIRRREIPAMIAELDKLRQQGILTDAEFQRKKAELLAQL